MDEKISVGGKSKLDVILRSDNVSEFLNLVSRPGVEIVPGFRVSPDWSLVAFSNLPRRLLISSLIAEDP